MIVGGNRALIEFFGYYSITKTPTNYKYLTRAAFFYRKMISQVSKNKTYDTNLPSIEDGKEQVACLSSDSKLYQDEQTTTTKDSFNSGSYQNPEKPQNFIKQAFDLTIKKANKAMNRISIGLNKLSEKPGMKLIEAKTHEFATKFEKGLHQIFKSLSSDPIIEKSVSNLHDAAETLVQEVKEKCEEIKDCPCVSQFKEDSEKLIKNIKNSFASDQDYNNSI